MGICMNAWDSISSIWEERASDRVYSSGYTRLPNIGLSASKYAGLFHLSLCTDVRLINDSNSTLLLMRDVYLSIP